MRVVVLVVLIRNWSHMIFGCRGRVPDIELGTGSSGGGGIHE